MRDGQLTLFGRPVWVEASPPLVGDGLLVGDLWVDTFNNNTNRCTSISPVTFHNIESGGGMGTVTNVATGTGLSGGPITTTGTITLANTAVTAGSYTLSAITVDAQGRLTSASSGSPQTITLTSDVTGSGTGSFATTIAAGAITLSKMSNLAANSIIGNNTGSPATPLALTSAQVSTFLSLGTLATQSGTFSGTSSGTNTGDQTITLTSDITGSGTGSFATTLATVNSNVGSYTNASITVNGKGLITAASSGTAPVTSVTGTTNRITSSGGATPAIDISASYVGQSSITTLGTITTGVWNGTGVTVPYGGTGVASTTAYTPICGGTTSTGAYQSVASVGSIGQVLGSYGSSALPKFIYSPQKEAHGRLSLTSSTPVTTTDVTAATTLYYTPYVGDRIDLYDGTATWVTLAFTEINIAIPSTTSTMYDVFCYNSSGTATLELLSWTNDTTRATALVYQNGILVKSGATTRRYLGSVRTTTVSGQTEDSVLKRYVWNYYNRCNRTLLRQESTATWTYSTATFRQANGSTSNQVDSIIGVSEDMIYISVFSQAYVSGNNNASPGIGLNSTTVSSASCQSSGPGLTNIIQPGIASYFGIPPIGRQYYVWLEQATTSGNATSWYGTSSNTQTGIFGYLRG